MPLARVEMDTFPVRHKADLMYAEGASAGFLPAATPVR